jgi:hypothetical protein
MNETGITTDENDGSFDYLPAKKHDVRALGGLIPGEDYSQYESDACSLCGTISQPEYWHETADHRGMKP